MALRFLGNEASTHLAHFELERGNVDEALAALIDVLRFNRRRALKESAINAVDAYVHAACLRSKIEVASRLHAFVTAYRDESKLRRSPFGERTYREIVAHYRVPLDPDPRLNDLDQALALALTI